MASFLVIGSMNVDLTARVEHIPRQGETLIARGLERHTGGKGGNQAYALARLGGDVALLGAVGDDGQGNFLLDGLRQVGVDVSRVRRADGTATGMAWIAVSDRGDNSIIVLPGANHAVDRAYIDAHKEALSACEAVILQLEVPLDTVEYAAQLARGMGKRVILDPAPARPELSRALLACADVVKPNETELAILTGIEGAAERLDEATDALRAMGARNVVVTLGGGGAYLKTEQGERHRFEARKVHVVDTTAAGDSFTAALTLRLTAGDTLKDAVPFAMRVAEIVVTRPGAQASIPTLQEVEAAIRTIE